MNRWQNKSGVMIILLKLMKREVGRLSNNTEALVNVHIKDYFIPRTVSIVGFCSLFTYWLNSKESRKTNQNKGQWTRKSIWDFN